MLIGEHAKSILQKVLAELEVIDYQNNPTHHGGSYLVIPGNAGTRWIIPMQPKFGMPVLNQWQPYGLSSRLKWKLLRLLYRLHLARFIPGVTCITGRDDKSLCAPDTQTEVVPVVYVGTPGAQQKAVVNLVDTGDFRPLSVMKVALSKGAQSSLYREATVLKQLANLGVPYVPLLMQDREEGASTFQTVLSGMPTGRKLTQQHIEWLLALPKTGEVTTLDKQREILQGTLDLCVDQMEPDHKATLVNAIDVVKGQVEIPLVLIHGDFAPWNIIQHPDHSLQVVDWEDAHFDGLPLWDLCHFYYMQAHLFDDMNPTSLLITSNHVSQYMNSLGVHKSLKQQLSLLYCLFQILKGKNVSEEYKYFMFDQLSELCTV